MSISIAVYGATGAVGSVFLAHLFNSHLLKPGDRLLLVGRGVETSHAKLTAMRVDLLDAFDDDEARIEVVDTLDNARADVLIMTAGATISPGIRTRRDLASANAPIFRDAALRFASASPAATVIVVSNPVELGVAMFCEHFDRRRVVGMGAQQDSLRFARAIAARLGVHRSRVRASVYGEHGEAMILAWSSVYLTEPDPALERALADLRSEFEGPPEANAATRAMTDVGALLGAERVTSAYDYIASASPQIRTMVEPVITATRLGSTPNATAHAIMAFIAAMTAGDERKLHGQVLLQGEFCSVHGVCGSPIHLSSGGWHIATHEPLTASEYQRVHAAAEQARRPATTASEATTGAP